MAESDLEQIVEAFYREEDLQDTRPKWTEAKGSFVSAHFLCSKVHEEPYHSAVEFFVRQVGHGATTFYFWWDEKSIQIAIEHSEKVYTRLLRYRDLHKVQVSEMLIVAGKLIGSRKSKGPELYALLAMASVPLAAVFFKLWMFEKGPLRLAV